MNPCVGYLSVCPLKDFDQPVRIHSKIFVMELWVPIMIMFF